MKTGSQLSALPHRSHRLLSYILLLVGCLLGANSDVPMLSCKLFFSLLQHIMPLTFCAIEIHLLTYLLTTSQESGWKECLLNVLFCVEWDMKP